MLGARMRKRPIVTTRAATSYDSNMITDGSLGLFVLSLFRFRLQSPRVLHVIRMSLWMCDLHLVIMVSLILSSLGRGMYQVSAYVSMCLQSHYGLLNFHFLSSIAYTRLSSCPIIIPSQLTGEPDQRANRVSTPTQPHYLLGKLT